MKSSLRSPLWQTEIPHSIDAIVRSSSTLIVMGSAVLRLLLLTLLNSQIFFMGPNSKMHIWPYLAIYGIFGRAKYGQVGWGAVQTRWSQVNRTLQSKVMTKSHFWPDRPLHCNYNYNFKVVARTDLWVYNAENLCVSFFNQVAYIFHLRGGKIKKVYFGPAYIVEHKWI